MFYLFYEQNAFFTLLKLKRTSTNILILREKSKAQMPILNKAKKGRRKVLRIEVIKVIFKLSLLFPIASKLRIKGEAIYCNKQIGAKNFK